MSDFNQNLTVLTNVSKMPHTKFYENICTSFWVTMQRDSLRDMVMLMDNFPLQIIQKCMLTLWAVPPYIHGSRWPGPWGYCWWFMLVKVYILALHLRSIAITSLPDLVLIFDTKKKKSTWWVQNYLLVKQTECGVDGVQQRNLVNMEMRVQVPKCVFLA